MLKQCLISKEIISQGETRGHLLNVHRSDRVIPIKAETFDEFAKQLPKLLEQYAEATDFDVEVQRAIDKLQDQNFAFMVFRMSDHRVNITIVPPKFD